MVQRQIPSKLCGQKTDLLKSQNRTGKLRPPSPRFPDGKNKGTEMKKKMKRSKSINRSTIESCLNAPNFIKQVPQPGKPPPNGKQKQLPNYMKSTSSFDARKEQSQVSSQVSVKGPKKELKTSKFSLSSGCIPAKTFTRMSSSNRVRALTKTPSFKPTRAANKKCSQVVLCKDLNSQRATCSSTLKDSKFPNYLELSSGATESEGTSLMKVCPYMYCSLNGHRHATLPPLKSFLSAKRRTLKTQKNLKLGCLLPRKMRSSADLERRTFGDLVVDDKAAIQEPRVQEDHMDCYIEIYVENRGDDSKTFSGRNGDGNEDGLSNEAPDPGNDFKNNLGDSCDVKETDAELFPQEEQLGEEAEEVNSIKSNQEETPETMSHQSEMELNGTDTGTYDMEWEEGQHPAEDKDGCNSENSSLIRGNNPSFHNEMILGISCSDEILVDETEVGFDQSGEDEAGNINSNNNEVSIEPVEDKETSALLAIQRQYSCQPQQDEIHQDYKSVENNTLVFEVQVCHEEDGDFLADSINSATNQIPEQVMEDEKQNKANESLIGVQTNLSMTDGDSNEVFDDKCLNVDPSNTDTINCRAQIFKSLNSIDSEDQTHSELNKVITADEIVSDIDAVEMAHTDNSEHNESSSAEKDETQKRAKTAYICSRGRSSEDLQSNTINLQITKCEKSEEDLEKERGFNPREPNYLPITPVPEAEKVDLRHQDLDDRKNAEEWMLDYALRQTVTKLAPARKRKVALLVEAFEKVIPPQFEPRLQRTSSAFATARPIQACS